MLEEGTFPDDWKRSNVVPVHKKEDRNLIKNYRPISLLLIFSKILERLIFNSIFNYFIEKNYSQSINQASYQVTHVFLSYYPLLMKFIKILIVTLH